MVNTAKSGRKIIAIDGCPLSCSKACLSNHHIEPDLHFELTQFGVKKKNHVDFDPNQADSILEIIEEKIANNNTQLKNAEIKTEILQKHEE